MEHWLKLVLNKIKQNHLSEEKTNYNDSLRVSSVAIWHWLVNEDFYWKKF